MSSDNTSSLLNKTLALLDADPRTPSELARASGLSYHWIVKMRARAIPDPSVNRVERLYSSLAKGQPTG